MSTRVFSFNARTNAHKQRFIAAGLCAYCGAPRAPGRRTCPKHATRTHHCRECDGTDHNVLKCPRLGKAA